MSLTVRGRTHETAWCKYVNHMLDNNRCSFKALKNIFELKSFLRVNKVCKHLGKEHVVTGFNATLECVLESKRIHDKSRVVDKAMLHSA